MPRGSVPGERRGGRGKGTKNKVHEPQREEARQLPQAVPVLSQIMTYFMGAAAAEQQKGDQADKKLIAEMLREARTTAYQLANWQQPKLSAITVKGDKDNPLRTIAEYDFSKLSDEQLLILRPILQALAPTAVVEGPATTH